MAMMAVQMKATKEYRRGFAEAKRQAQAMVRTWRKTVEDRSAKKALKGLAYDLRHDLIVEPYVRT